MANPTTRTPVASKNMAKLSAGTKNGSIPNLGNSDLVEGYVPARLPEGTVVGVWGKAIIRPPGGGQRPLVPGDEVHKGDMILTSQNGIVEIRHEGSRLARLPAGESLENILVAVNTGDAPPGAGAASGGSLQPGLRVDRLVEIVGSQEYDFDGAQPATSQALVIDVDNSLAGVASVEVGGCGS